MENPKFNHGTINWRDLTVKNAEELKEFYKEVAGWQTEDMPMKDGSDEYSDYIMKDLQGNPVAGVCNSRGVNTGIPPQWIMYISVENVTESLDKALKLGGKLLKEHKAKDGSLVYAMIEDPAGAVFALAKTQF